MKVTMLIDTHFGKALKAGDTADVPKDTAERWIKNRIAAPAQPAKRAGRRGGEAADDE